MRGVVRASAEIHTRARGNDTARPYRTRHIHRMRRGSRTRRGQNAARSARALYTFGLQPRALRPRDTLAPQVSVKASASIIC
jgi:hypothetical protein